MTTPRIYIACLAAYNNGKLHGQWVNCVDIDEVQEAIATVLKTSPEAGAEEYAVHDSEGFGPFNHGEWPDLKELCLLGAAIEEHGEIFSAFVSHMGIKDMDSAVESFEDCNAGEWSSLEDFAENLLDDTGALSEMPESLRPYFDFEKYANDMDCNGDVFTIDVPGGVHVFWNR